METIQELESYLEDNCYSFLGLSIGKHHAYEGFVIEENNGKYNFSYSERGNKCVLESFSTEYELVQYALARLSEDEWARAHIVASTFKEKTIIKAEKQLDKINIHYKRNDILNYNAGKTMYRIFVFGKDILKLTNFKKKYLYS